jgi:hypothetical protein
MVLIQSNLNFIGFSLVSFNSGMPRLIEIGDNHQAIRFDFLNINRIDRKNFGS